MLAGNEVLSVLIAEGLALVWLIFKLDKRLAVIETEIRYIKRQLRLDTGGGSIQ